MTPVRRKRTAHKIIQHVLLDQAEVEQAVDAEGIGCRIPGCGSCRRARQVRPRNEFTIIPS